jgi:hypothetical protein
MSRIERADRIEGIVGAKRHPTDHFARAMSTEERVYEYDDLIARRASKARQDGIDIPLDDVHESFISPNSKIRLRSQHYSLMACRECGIGGRWFEVYVPPGISQTIRR